MIVTRLPSNANRLFQRCIQMIKEIQTRSTKQKEATVGKLPQMMDQATLHIEPTVLRQLPHLIELRRNVSTAEQKGAAGAEQK
jgi:hypothetical protein